VPSAAGAFDVVVASACSGIAGILGMLLVGLCAQYVLHGSRRARLAWLGAAVALAWVFNLVRILVLLAVGTTLGEGVAMDVVHPVAGLLLLNSAMAVHVLLAGRFGLVLGLRRPVPYDTPLTASVPAELRRDRGQVARRATALLSGVLVLAALGTVVPGTAAAYAGSLPAVRPFADNPSLGSQFRVSDGVEKKWAERYFGEDSSWMRYEAEPLSAAGGYTVWVDSVFTRDWSGLRAHPIVECYAFHDFELVRVARPRLTSGLLADEIVYRREDGATWHVLSWEWAVRTGDDIAHERVTLLASSLDDGLDPGAGGETGEGG
jgi:exosortase/archaeosortase family protein